MDKVQLLMETQSKGYVLFCSALLFSQGDRGFPGEHGPPGQKGVGEPGAKVGPIEWMEY